MYLGRVVGALWATIRHPSLVAGRFLLLQPVDQEGRPEGQPLAALDTVGSGVGELVLYTTAYEAALPWKELHPGLDVAAVDASVVAIVDAVDQKSGGAP